MVISKVDLAMQVHPLPWQLLFVQWTGPEIQGSIKGPWQGNRRKSWVWLQINWRVPRREQTRFLLIARCFITRQEMRSLAKNTWGAQQARDSTDGSSEDSGGGGAGGPLNMRPLVWGLGDLRCSSPLFFPAAPLFQSSQQLVAFLMSIIWHHEIPLSSFPRLEEKFFKKCMHCHRWTYTRVEP